MIKRLFDTTASLIGLAIFSPLFLIISILIICESRGSVFYLQVRVGKDNHDFFLYKFRTMHTDAEKSGLLTVGKKDPRVTKVGYYLRRFKLDELPQLINVLNGDMSIVGPRPEVRKYVDLYSEQQLNVLKVRPGITDPASILYFRENEILAQTNNPEKTYINEIMPAKLRLNLEYISKQSFISDIIIIIKTIFKVFK